MFGAWPQRRGAGGQLLDEVLQELRSSRVSMLARARDKGLADKYVTKYHATHLDPARPLLVAWIND
jgi:hypothetical protein